MSTAVTARDPQETALINKLVMEGDLAKFTDEEQLAYYYAVCERAGLDPLSQPLEYLTLNKKLVLYFKSKSTDQIAGNRGLSRRVVDTKMVGAVYLVIAECTDRAGRVEQSTGAASIQGLTGDNLVNAMLRAESKAKRRSVISFTGLGFMDESDADSIPGAMRVEGPKPNPHQADADTGEVDETKAPITPQLTAKLVDYVTRIKRTYGEDAGNLPTVEDFKAYTVAEAKEMAAHLVEFGAELKAKREAAQVAQEPIEELAGV